MKKTIVFLGISFVIIFSLTLIFRPANASGPVRYSQGNPELPDTILKFVQRACFDCHGEDGSGMAKSHVNLAKWNSYDAKKQASKAIDMSKEVSKGAMPPGKWRKNNPDIIPTAAEASMLKNWAAALNK